MRFVVLRAGAVLLALWWCVCVASAADGAAKTADTSCHLYRAAHFHLSWSQDQQPLVKAVLDGKGVEFVVASAGCYNFVSADVASALHLKTKKIRWHSGPIRHPYSVATVTKAQFGSIPVPNMPFVVTADSLPANGGTIGGGFLSLFDVEYDPAASEMSLFFHNACPSRIVHWTNGPRVVLPFQQYRVIDSQISQRLHGLREIDPNIVIPAKLDGKDVDLHLSTAAPISHFLVGYADALVSPEERKALKPVEGKFATETPSYWYPGKILDLGGVQIRNPKIIIPPASPHDDGRRVFGKPQIYLGANILNQLHFYIAYKDKKIYITAASAH